MIPAYSGAFFFFLTSECLLTIKSGVVVFFTILTLKLNLLTLETWLMDTQSKVIAAINIVMKADARQL